MISRKEIVFQFLLHALVLLFYSYDRHESGVRLDQIGLFVNYTLATLFVTYFLMPRYLYNGKHWQFFIAFILVIMAVILVEEYIMEPLLYPDSKRSENFAGFFPTMLDVLPAITILAGGKFGWDAIQKQQQIDALQSTVEESELQFLRSQIHPHFLFNNLNNLYSYALVNSPKTPEIILELSGVLRYMLYECKEAFVPLNKELEQLENFIKLYKLQIEERGQVFFHNNCEETHYKIAPLILVVFIENAFKHSQSGQSNNIKIDISVQMQGETLIFSCVNNFVSVEKATSEPKGIGLENVQKRLQLLYPGKHSLQFSEQAGQYVVNLALKLETQSS